MPHPAPPPPRRPSLPGPAAWAVLALAAVGWAPLALAPAASLADDRGRLELGAADVVLQRRPEGCALAALVMLLAARGITADQEDLARLAGDRLGPRGLTLTHVADVAADAGLRGTWWAATGSDLDALTPPFAAHLAAPGAPSDHLVVVRRVDTAGVLVADPAAGLVAWPRSAFLASWTGRAFVPEAP